MATQFPRVGHGFTGLEEDALEDDDILATQFPRVGHGFTGLET